MVVNPISVHLEYLTEPRGEFTVVVSKPDPDGVTHAELPSPRKLALEFGELTKYGRGSRREIVKDLADRYGLSARDMYRLLETGKED